MIKQYCVKAQLKAHLRRKIAQYTPFDVVSNIGTVVHTSRTIAQYWLIKQRGRRASIRRRIDRLEPASRCKRWTARRTAAFPGGRRRSLRHFLGPAHGLTPSTP
jgi:hypothetical protein